MKPRLVVIANATEARLLSRASRAEPLVELATFDDALGRRHGSELQADRPGHGSSDHRPGGVTFEPRLDPRRKRHLQFASRLADEIEAALNAGNYASLVVVASSPFLGELGHALGASARRLPGYSFELDLTSCSVHELEQRLDPAVWAEFPPEAHH
jgi:protein required for attachment to host cells